MTYDWDGNVSDSTIANPTIGEAGEYILTVTTLNNCMDMDTMFSFISNDQPIPVISASDISCFGMNDGFIQIESISGGVPPYTCSFNGGPFTDGKIFMNLTGGSYSIIVEDAGGCQSPEFIFHRY